MNLSNLKYLKLTFLSYCTRSICVSSKTMKSYPSREKKIMNKLMHGTSGKKKYFNNALPSPSSLSKGAFEGKRSVNYKRIAMLNKLFMKNITDLMATGEYSNEFVGKGIEISRVQTTPDFHGVNVFWAAKGSESDHTNIEKVLNKYAGALRHELSQLKVMGVVPKITFVKDKLGAQLAEIDQRLEKADFGDDYTPINPMYRMKEEFTLNRPIADHLRSAISSVEKDLEEEEIIEEPLPLMRNDVFGLNHAEIMAKVKAQIKKSKAPHRQSNISENVRENPLDESGTNKTIVEFKSFAEQKQAFESFLHKRKVMRAKANREISKNYSPDKEYLYDEYLKELEEDYNADNLEKDDDGDVR